MGGGGAERVVALLANSLASAGNYIEIHTLVGGESFYSLHPAVCQTNDGLVVNRKNKVATITSELTGFPKAFFVLNFG